MNKKDNELPITEEIEKYLVGGGELRPSHKVGIDHPEMSASSVVRNSLSTKITNLHYVFCTVTGRPYIRQYLGKIWKVANKKAHSKYGVIILPLKNATRHSLASRLLEEGQPLEVIARILGNSEKVVEQNYGRIRTQKVMGILEGR